ncbi:GntR family transcriptional regulator [Phycicoccus sp. M110.8]|uniref:GntR family transcriptional regulator n=1 Tax=Phycicoccus sp. M110.8 TaxID=3075433 RepID=UPI0028FD96A1|nr:GntR family transcriptional regulator [Phycicoccus sp. M110.8]MDU0313180.1 GntR family transcriptional regulator [Phycicoccus sp. M110.8]
MLELGQVDKTSDKPAFKQIAEEVRAAVTTGRLEPGDRVPSESQLMEHFGVARMTVRQALADLRAEGLLVAEHGRGVFVRERPVVRRVASDRFARRHREDGQAAFLAEADGVGVPSVDQLAVGAEPASPAIREVLALPVRAKVVARRRRYLMDGRPVELAESFVPQVIAGGTKIAESDTGPGGIYARLEELGHQLAEFSEEVAARMPTPEERRRLQLPAGTPVLTVRRIAYDTAGTPVEMTDTVKAAPSYVLEYRFPAN